MPRNIDGPAGVKYVNVPVPLKDFPKLEQFANANCLRPKDVILISLMKTLREGLSLSEAEPTEAR